MLLPCPLARSEEFSIELFGVQNKSTNTLPTASKVWEMGFVLIRHSAVEHRRVYIYIYIYGSRIIGLVCKGETVGKKGEVDEMGERELVLVVSVRCGKERDMTRG